MAESVEPTACELSISIRADSWILNIPLRRALAPEGDSVIFQDRVIHVASWAARFLFTGEQLGQPVEKLSGGERARVLIAQLMLQPADVFCSMSLPMISTFRRWKFWKKVCWNFGFSRPGYPRPIPA